MDVFCLLIILWSGTKTRNVLDLEVPFLPADRLKGKDSASLVCAKKSCLKIWNTREKLVNEETETKAEALEDTPQSFLSLVQMKRNPRVSLPMGF